jgi:hypothetical protein
MSPQSRLVAGIALVTIPTIEYGGAFLLSQLRAKARGYVDNPLRQNLFRAGHAHAGVLVILLLVGLSYVDQANLSENLRWLVRLCLFAAPLLIPAGFFGSVLLPSADKPGGLIVLTYVGAAVLAVGAITLGIGLITS